MKPVTAGITVPSAAWVPDAAAHVMCVLPPKLHVGLWGGHLPSAGQLGGVRHMSHEKIMAKLNFEPRPANPMSSGRP